MSKNKIKDIKELGVKLGSDEMVFWRDVIDGKEQDVSITKRNLKLFEAILAMAKEKYSEAEAEFNKK